MRTKVCSKCRERKDIFEFSFKSKPDDVRRAECKKCFSLLTARHYSLNDVKYKASRDDTRNRNREFLLSYLKDKQCVDCGNSDIRVLEFDHLKDKKNGVSVLALKGYGLNTLKEEIAKCEIRCRNCHAIKTHKEQNSYRHKSWLKDLGSME